MFHGETRGSGTLACGHRVASYTRYFHDLEIGRAGSPRRHRSPVEIGVCHGDAEVRCLSRNDGAVGVGRKEENAPLRGWDLNERTRRPKTDILRLTLGAKLDWIQVTVRTRCVVGYLFLPSTPKFVCVHPPGFRNTFRVQIWRGGEERAAYVRIGTA